MSHLRLVHSQPIESVKTRVEMRKGTLTLALILLADLAFYGLLFFLIIKAVP